MKSERKNNPLEEVVRVGEAAWIVGVDEATIIRAAESGKLNTRPSRAGAKTTYLIEVSSLREAYPLKFNEKRYQEILKGKKDRC